MTEDIKQPPHNPHRQGIEFDGMRQYAARLPELATLLRLVNAAATVRAQADTGALFEGYDGAEPQRTQACAALDELEDATDAAIAALQAIAARSAARQVHHL